MNTTVNSQSKENKDNEFVKNLLTSCEICDIYLPMELQNDVKSFKEEISKSTNTNVKSLEKQTATDKECNVDKDVIDFLKIYTKSPNKYDLIKSYSISKDNKVEIMRKIIVFGQRIFNMTKNDMIALCDAVNKQIDAKSLTTPLATPLATFTKCKDSPFTSFNTLKTVNVSAGGNKSVKGGAPVNNQEQYMDVINFFYGQE